MSLVMTAHRMRPRHRPAQLFRQRPSLAAPHGTPDPDPQGSVCTAHSVRLLHIPLRLTRARPFVSKISRGSCQGATGAAPPLPRHGAQVRKIRTSSPDAPSPPCSALKTAVPIPSSPATTAASATRSITDATPPARPAPRPAQAARTAPPPTPAPLQRPAGRAAPPPPRAGPAPAPPAPAPPQGPRDPIAHAQRRQRRGQRAPLRLGLQPLARACQRARQIGQRLGPGLAPQRRQHHDRIAAPCARREHPRCNRAPPSRAVATRPSAISVSNPCE